VTFTEWVRPPPVPLMVIVRVPVDTVEKVSTVNTELPAFTTEVGLNVFVAADGAPLTVRFTVPVNPLNAVIVTVYVATPPTVIVRLVGEAEIEKSPLTIKVALIVRARGPLAPRIFRV
jgi:hypothetical protein